METILTFFCLLCGLACFLLNLFMHLSYGDMMNGAVGAHDIVRLMNRYLRFEFALHFFISFASLLHQDYFLFIFTTPLSLYTAVKLASRDAYFNPLTVLMFHEKRKHEFFIKAKMIYYSMLILWQLLNFSLAFSSAMVYNLFGDGIRFFSS